MKLTYASMFVIALVLMSGLPLMTSLGSINYATARYAPANTQSQANSNECDTGTNCSITSPQTQGDGTANSPTNLQISKFNEAQEEGVGGGIVSGNEIEVTLTDFPGQTGISVTIIPLNMPCVEPVRGPGPGPIVQGSSDIVIPGIGKGTVEVMCYILLIPSPPPVPRHIVIDFTITNLPGQTAPSKNFFFDKANDRINIPGIGSGQARVLLLMK